MNGHFERDRGAYPFQGMAIGDNFKVVYVPSLDQLS